jgi:hypothetical protein
MSISFKCKIKGLDKLDKKINKIIKNLPLKVEESIEDILKNIQGYAIRLERGHNSEGILVEMIETSIMQVKGKVYASPDKFMIDNKSYLWFEYFGTGQYAEQEHIGKTEHFKETGYTEWYIPVEKVARSLNYPIKVINGRKFYIAHGAKPNHFITDAEFKTRNENTETVEKKLKQFFEEVCK